MSRVQMIGRTFGTLALVFVSAQVGAQASEGAGSAPPSAQPEPNAGTIAIAVPATTAPVARSFHMHDGFYARVSPGIGWVDTTWSAEGRSDIEAGGTSLAIDLLVGGSPTRGVAVGGALLSHLMLSTDVTVGGEDEPAKDLDLLLLGPFIDGFPTASGGWHMGGTVGLARAHLAPLKAWGFGGAAWAGYDAWIGDEWSVGGLARFMLTGTNAEDTDDIDVSATGATLTLAFTALFN